MKPKIKIAVAKVLALHAEFTSAELEEAYRYLYTSAVGQLFGVGTRMPNTTDVRPRGRAVKSAPARSSASSNLLNELQKDDEEKFRILNELETMLRSSGAAISMEDIRGVATSLDKENDVGKSKRDAIPKLLQALSAYPTEDIHDRIKHLIGKKENSGADDDSYVKLAKFLVRGE